MNLARRGHYEGAASGSFTDETKAALGVFQSEIGVAPTGSPDQGTLWQLLRASPPR